MDKLIYQKSYTEFREELRSELKRTAEGFVRIGYLLRVARDTDILKASGYSGLEDFARGEFDLDKTQVSRFIRINERFSEGGNSDKLMTSYADFGVRKLGLMLTLPDEINEELSPEYTVDEINSIKETYDEEKKVSPLEDYMEQQEAKAEEDKAAALAETDILSAVIYQIGHDDPEIFVQMFESEDLCGDKDLFSVLAPGGESTHKVRIKGVGALLMVCTDKDVTIMNMRSLAKETHFWKDANNAFENLMNTNCPTESDAKAAWQQMYGEPYPEKTEVAPVQQEAKPEKKPLKVVDHIKTEKKESQTTKTLKTESVFDKKLSETLTNSENPLTGDMSGADKKGSHGSVTDMSKAESVDDLKKAVYGNPAEEDLDKETGDTEQDTPTEAAVVQKEAAGIEEGSRDATWANIERAHGEALRIAEDIRNTFDYEPAELGADDMRNIQEQIKKLQMHLEILIAGYDVLEKQ